MPIKNHTTKVQSMRTIGQIGEFLAKHGARKIVTDIDDDGDPVGVTFSFAVNGRMFLYALPCNWEGVQKMLNQGRKKSDTTKQRALQVAWRTIQDWIEAQVAIIEAGMATIAEVFLPYAVTADGKTVFEKLSAGDNRLELMEGTK